MYENHLGKKFGKGSRGVSYFNMNDMRVSTNPQYKKETEESFGHVSGYMHYGNTK